MMMLLPNPLKAISLFLFVVLICAASVSAQDDGSTAKQKGNLTDENVPENATQISEALNRRNEFTVIGGIAPNTPSRFFDSGRDSTFGFVAFRYSRRLGAKNYILLKYTVDFIPAAFIKYDERRVMQTAVTQLKAETVYGFGISPAGIQLNFRRARKVQPFVSADIGWMRFSESIPDDSSTVFPNREGRRSNIVFSVGGGVEFATKRAKSFIAGFKFQHISNVSTANINPGFNQNLFYFGYTFKKW